MRGRSAWRRAGGRPEVIAVLLTHDDHDILGTAGLLRGRRATSHWLVRDALLPRLGATPVAARVVEDGADLITAAGVTAGLDLGLALVRRLAGEDYARTIALLAECPAGAPQVSSPELGRPSEAEALKTMFGPLLTKACEAADWAATHFPPGANTADVAGRPRHPMRERSH